MKNIIVFISLFCFSIVGYSQEEQDLAVFIADSTWQKEVLKLPLGFAREIDYKGFEDIRFAKGWAKKESPELWMYTFAWHVKGIQKPTKKEFEKYMTLYFNGLMLPYNNDELKIPGATVVFSKNKPDSKDYDFSGSINTYDKFHTKKRMTLNTTIKSYFCEAKNTSTIVFRFSLKPLEHKLWQKFDEVTLRDDICNN